MCFFLSFFLQNLPGKFWKKSFQNRKNSELWSGTRTENSLFRQSGILDLRLLYFSLMRGGWWPGWDRGQRTEDRDRRTEVRGRRAGSGKSQASCLPAVT